MNRSPEKIPAILIGADASFLFNVGRNNAGEVVILSKYQAVAMSPVEARQFAAKIVRAADRIERGDIPMAPGREAG